MKDGSKLLKFVLVGVFGAAVMIGCSSDDAGGYPEDQTTSTVEETTTTTSTVEEATTTTSTVEETTTTVEETATTVPRPTTTVKKTTATTAPPTTSTLTIAPTTQAPTTAPMTQAPTTAPTVTLPPVNVSAEWSGIGEGCPENHDLYLDVNVFGATSAGTISVRVGGSPVTSYGGSNFAIGDTTMILFDQWPNLAPGTYSVAITATSATQGPTTVTKSVTYNCPP